MSEKLSKEQAARFADLYWQPLQEACEAGRGKPIRGLSGRVLRAGSLIGNGLLTVEQSSRFVDLIVEDELVKNDAAACLYWWQRLFRRFLLAEPSGVLRVSKIRRFA